jgi:hypothetical protein
MRRRIFTVSSLSKEEDMVFPKEQDISFLLIFFGGFFFRTRYHLVFNAPYLAVFNPALDLVALQPYGFTLEPNLSCRI